MVNPLRCYALAACAVSFWLAALSPVPPKFKGGLYCLALGAAVQLINDSKKLIAAQAWGEALQIVDEELKDVELALHTYNQEEKLKQQYAAEATYSPEIRDELIESLEHLYEEELADHPAETSASASTAKAFYLAVKKLLEVENETFVIEKILKMGGRQWKEGKRRLEEILEEGRQNEW